MGAHTRVVAKTKRRTKNKEHQHSHSLTLRKHSVSLELSREFRVFVVNGTITGISQRDVTSFYPFLVSEKSKIGWTIERFWKDEIRPSAWHKKICGDGSVASTEKRNAFSNEKRVLHGRGAFQR